MNGTLDFEELTLMNNEMLNNVQLFNRTARNNRHFRLNVRKGTLAQVKTSRPNSITLTPREVDNKEQSPPQSGGYDVSLPKLSSKHKERRKIDRTFLQQWLNSALEEAGGKGPLRGVKKYQIDKRHLLGQNISQSEIDKLYHSLYIYSYGFRKVLTDLLSEKEDMILKFWRVFLKLIEQTSEYDNLFAIVQRRHNETVEDLRKALMKKDQEIQQLKVESEDRLREISRQLNGRIEEIKDLKVEKFVLQSNFQLTDEAFNDEVALRLRFEEKINSINTAYGELKTKYARLVEDLKVHREGTQSHYEREKQYINEKGNYEMRILEQEKLVSIERERLKLKEKEITEIRQQLFELQQQKLAKVRKEDEQEVELKTALIRQRKVTLRLAEETDKKETAEKKAEDQTIELKKTQQHLQTVRKNLEEEFATGYLLRQEISSLKKELEERMNRISTLQLLNSQLKKSLEQASNITTKQSESIGGLQKELEFNKKRVALLEESLSINQKTIEGLRDTKDKHEKLYRIIEKQQSEALQALNQANKKVFQLEEEKKGYVIMMQTKDHTSSQTENRLKTELQITRNKINAQISQLGHKDNMILKANDKIDELKNTIMQKHFLVDKLQQSVFELTNNLSREAFERKNLEGKCKLLDDTVKNHRVEIQKLNLSVINLKKTNATLSTDKSALSYVIDEKKKLTESETEAIKGLLKSYKEQLETLLQYIHPMHYWDKEAQVNRLQDRINPLLSAIEKFKEAVKTKEQEIVNNQNELAKFKRFLSEERSHGQSAESELLTTKVALAKAQQQLQASKKEIQGLQEKIAIRDRRMTEDSKKIQELEKVIKDAKAKKDSMVSVFSQTKVKITNEESVQVDLEVRATTKHSHASKTSRDEERRQETHATTKAERKEAETQTDAIQLPQPEPQLKSPPPQEPEEVLQSKQLEDTGPGKTKPVVSRPPVPAKPVTNKEFSKALKFTFMRK